MVASSISRGNMAALLLYVLIFVANLVTEKFKNSNAKFWREAKQAHHLLVRKMLQQR